MGKDRDIMEWRPGRCQGGFTLIEMVIVIVIITIIGGVLFHIIISSTDAWVFLSSRQEMVQDGRVAMLRMIREIRGATSIGAATTNEIRFTIPNGDVIGYRWMGTVDDPLECRVGTGAFYPLASNVQDFEFEYWSMDVASPMSPPGTDPELIDDIRRIVIKLGLRKDDGSFYLESQVHPRNF